MLRSLLINYLFVIYSIKSKAKRVQGAYLNSVHEPARCGADERNVTSVTEQHAKRRWTEISHWVEEEPCLPGTSRWPR